MTRRDDDTAPRGAVILLAALLLAGIGAVWLVPDGARDTRIAAPASVVVDSDADR
ncbi:MAG TPA: hypothetical protein VFD92_02375 [Candidatus Binatia bacterium]|nr:hypothetical protein [Candidatus Binatia bacterium]